MAREAGPGLVGVSIRGAPDGPRRIYRFVTRTPPGALRALSKLGYTRRPDGVREAGRAGATISRYHLSEYAGREMELVRVDPGVETEEYPDFVLHEGVRMTVRDVRSGDEGVSPLMDVLVEMEGGWKFLDFGDDP